MECMEWVTLGFQVSLALDDRLTNIYCKVG